MRWDMYEVIIERPRGGAGWGPKGQGRARMRDRVDPEQAAQREPISMHRGGSKHLNENLAPLRRFLVRRVGRKWDAVYAEICATLRPDSAVQKHVLDHLRDMVYTDVEERDGVLYERGRWGVRAVREGRHRWAPVYVCPTTGVLKRVPTTPRVPPPVERDVVPIDANGQYRRIAGVWYHITLSPVPESLFYEDAYDVVLGGSLRDFGPDWTRSARLKEQYGRGDRYASAKRQIGKRELRLLPLEVRG